MAAEITVVQLQLAMAFGQGAGVMLAEGEALEKLLAEQGEVIQRALPTWTASQYAFTDLVRILGQLSATRAAASGSPVIRWVDVQPSLAPILDLCPCFERRRLPNDGR